MDLRTEIVTRLYTIAQALEIDADEAVQTITELQENRPPPPALIDFCRRHNQSLDFVLDGDLKPMIRRLARQGPNLD
jgi:hypothetical protein